MNTLRPHIDEILHDFFARQLEDKTGLRRKRIERVETSLRAFLEADGHRVLVDDDLVVLNAEREFHPDTAFVQSMRADDLMCALGGFVREPWLAENSTDRGVQLRTVDMLAGHVVGHRLINQYDMMCHLLELRDAIDQAKFALRHGADRSGHLQRAATPRSDR